MARWNDDWLSQYVEDNGLKADGWPPAPNKEYSGTRTPEVARQHKLRTIARKTAEYERYLKRKAKR